MVVYRSINGIEFGVNINKGNGLLCTREVMEYIDGDIYEFVEYLYNKEKKYTPVVATWEITNNCNYKCPFCYINTPNKKKSVTQSFETIKQYIDDLVEEGLLIVYLTGGEIFTVADFKEIYKYLKTKGVFVVLLTNLSLLSEEIIKLFEEYPPLRITNSIYGLSEKQFCEVTGQDYRVCKVVLDNVLKIKEMGINITCQMPVNKYTVGDLIEISEWCYINGIRFTYSNELTDSYYSESRKDGYIDDDIFDDYKNKIKQIDGIISNKEQIIKREYGFKHHFDCRSGKHTYAVSYEGHLRPCFNIWENDYQGFDGSISMKKAMEEMKAEIERIKDGIIYGCKGCEAVNLCSECIYTQLKYKSDLKEYMNRQCKKNLELLNNYKTN